MSIVRPAQMTREIIQAIAFALNSKDHVRDGVIDVVIEGRTEVEVAQANGCTPQAVHNNIARYRRVHAVLMPAYCRHAAKRTVFVSPTTPDRHEPERVAAWNRTVMPGSHVLYQARPDVPAIRVRTRGPAHLSRSMRAIVLLDGIRGCVPLSQCVTESDLVVAPLRTAPTPDLEG